MPLESLEFYAVVVSIQSWPIFSLIRKKKVPFDLF
jgi:hypothetical protein